MSVAASPAEKAAARPGGRDRGPGRRGVMDRALTVDGLVEAVCRGWVQLGKRRAGWHLSGRVERLLTRSRRARRSVNPTWLSLRAALLTRWVPR